MRKKLEESRRDEECHMGVGTGVGKEGKTYRGDEVGQQWTYWSEDIIIN